MRPRKLTFNDIRAKREYEKYTIGKAEEYELLDQLSHLLIKANGTFDDDDKEQLQCDDILDPQLDQGFSGGFRVLRLLTFR
jgi:hypothetical protein